VNKKSLCLQTNAISLAARVPFGKPIIKARVGHLTTRRMRH